MQTKWDDAWFATDGGSYAYNHELATAASVLACAAYNKKTLAGDYETLGFIGYQDDAATYFPSDSDLASDYDLVGYSIAAKDVDRPDGSTAPLIAVSIRGTTDNREWVGNLNLSDSSKQDPSDVHEGFDAAAEQVLGAVKGFASENGIDLSDARLLVTGHSRGAAVANLVAAAADSGKLSDASGAVKAGNVYAYTFATPTVTKSANANNGLYHNIHNIVNPEDIVPKVPLGKWGYYRYGRTLMLPSKSNVAPWTYSSLKAKMNAQFRDFTNGVDYKPYRLGAGTADLIALTMGACVPSVKAYYDYDAGSSFYYKVRRLVEACMVNGGDTTVSEKLVAVSGVADKQPLLALGLLYLAGVDTYADYAISAAGRQGVGGIVPLGDEVSHGHTQETYVAWMKTIDASFFEGRTYLGVTIGCPVDVNVYDKDGNLVCKIEGNAVDESVMENGLAAYVIGDEKHVILPGDSKYRIETVATDDGAMDFQVEEFAEDGTRTDNAKAYLGVPLAKDQAFECSVSEDAVVSNAVLVTGGSEASADAVVAGEQVKKAAVAVSSEGDGDAWGTTEATVGSTVTVHAAAHDGASFLGWYAEGEKTSDSADYSFKAENDVNLVARFSAASSVTVSVAAEEGGTAGVVTGGGSEGSAEVASGSAVTVSATPDASHDFAGWSDGSSIVSRDAEYTFVASDDVTLTAKFNAKQTGGAGGGTSGGGTSSGSPASGGGASGGSSAGGSSAGSGAQQAVSLKGAAVTVADFQVYSGEALTPAVAVKLADGSVVPDGKYDVAYNDNLNAGTATVTVTAKADSGYSDSATGTFEIARRPVMVTPDDKSKVAGAADPELTATVSGAVGADKVAFALSREPGEAPGVYGIAASGDAEQGNYAVTFGEGAFTILGAVKTVDIKSASVTLPKSKYTYTGGKIMPDPTVTLGGKKLVPKRDYTVAYSSNLNAGTGKVVVTGIGSYSGEAQKTFKIVKAANPMKLKASAKSLKASQLAKKQKAGIQALAFKVKPAGKVTYASASGKRAAKWFKVAKRTGKLTVKKGTPTGSYKVKVRATAAGDANHVRTSIVATVNVRVR